MDEIYLLKTIIMQGYIIMGLLILITVYLGIRRGKNQG